LSDNNGGKYECECNNDNIFNGLCKFYDSSNNLKGEMNYENGKREGQFFEYYSNGKLKESGTYRQNKMLNFSHYDKNNVLNLMCEVDKNIWISYKYYKNKKLFIEKYHHSDSLLGGMVIDSSIYYVNTATIYKYISGVDSAMYKCINNKCTKIPIIGQNENDLIKTILGKDTINIYYIPDPLPIQKWF